MKFAHDFKQSLTSQGFPPHWIAHAIPYGQLKKCLKKVQQEMRDLGLDAETLRVLLDPNTDSPVAVKCRLSAASSDLPGPKLTIVVHLQDGVIVDASLATNSRRFLQKAATELSSDRNVAHIEPHLEAENAGISEENILLEPRNHQQGSTARVDDTETQYDMIEVPLVFGEKFFDILQSDVNNLDTLQAEEQKILTEEIVELGKEVSQVSRPSRFSKSDLDRWRHIFELYLDAEVFFATHEREHGVRTSQKALIQLQWFQTEVERQRLAIKFNLPESQIIFSRFLNLNLSLLKCVQFQELNKLAVSKILKKFDKRTSLVVSDSFPKANDSARLLSGQVAKDVCAQISQQLVGVVPQLNDYLCPVCYSIAFRPVRLDCRHVFCIRCIIKIQRRNEKHCPLCRAEVVMDASEANLDYELEKFMRKYFALEVKEKRRANEIERGIEDFGPGYTHHGCIIM